MNLRPICALVFLSLAFSTVAAFSAERVTSDPRVVFVKKPVKPIKKQVPEIDATAGMAAFGFIGAIMLLAYERRRKVPEDSGPDLEDN